MDEVDNFDWLVLTIIVSLIQIGTDVGNRLSFEIPGYVPPPRSEEFTEI